MSAHLREAWRERIAAERALPLDWPHETLYHATGGFEADEILRGGFRLPTVSRNGSDYGTAIYFSPERSLVSSYGHRVLVAQLAPSARILDLRYCWEAGIFDKHYEGVSRDIIRATADRLGYAGVTDGDIVALFDPSAIGSVR